LSKKRSRKSRAKAKAFSIGNKLFPVAKVLSTTVPFIEQISAKHRQTMGASFTNAPTMQKLKILSNIVTGSVTGINLFSQEFQAPQTLNPSGVFNKWTSAGALGIGYSIIGNHVNKMLGNRILPQTSKIGTLSKSVLVSGALGGFFDDPPVTQSTNVSKGTASLSPQPTLQLSRVSSGGSDSTESGL
jgi:hypothetical protein